jgi:hypothetical protein
MLRETERSDQAEGIEVEESLPLTTASSYEPLERGLASSAPLRRILLSPLQERQSAVRINGCRFSTVPRA